MKLVCERSIKQKVDDLIDEALSKGLDILRLETNPKDFVSLMPYMNPNSYTTDMNKPMGSDGDYLMYRGVCIQCHSDYPRTTPQIEIIK